MDGPGIGQKLVVRRLMWLQAMMPLVFSLKLTLHRFGFRMLRMRVSSRVITNPKWMDHFAAVVGIKRRF
jgi:hypothetical protein